MAMPDRLPRNSCDAHLHVFGDVRTYPVGNPNALYRPPQDCTFEAMKALHDAMGIERAVFVQPTIYGTDQTCCTMCSRRRQRGNTAASPSSTTA